MVYGARFFVDELLWMLSWGWYQLIFGIIFMWSLHMMIRRMKTVSALVLTISSYAFSMFVYVMCVAGIFINYFQWEFIAERTPQVYNPLYASFFLGLIYSFLQLLFYFLLSFWRNTPVVRLFIISLLSNIAAALIASCFIKVVF